MRLGAFIPPWGPTATADDFDTVAAGIERLGYDAIWIGDHAIFPRAVRSTYPYNASGRSPFDPDGPLFEPLTLLAYLAARTSRVKLGISVLVLPMRHPHLVAKMLANLQALSRGRVVLGVGAGWMREEFELLGADYATRGALTDEYMRKLRRAWSGDDREVGFQPRPQPSIPILVGGSSAPALRRAARLGDGWNAIRMTPEEIGPVVSRLRQMVEDEGRDPADFKVVLRAPLAAEKVADRLADYAAAGVDEFTVEVPDVTTAERLAHLAGIAAAAGLRT